MVSPARAQALIQSTVVIPGARPNGAWEPPRPYRTLALRLDVATLFAATSAIILVIGILFMMLGWQRDRAPGLLRFGVAYLVGGVAILLSAARGSLPLVVSIDLANALLQLAYGLIWSAMRRFAGRRTPLPLVVGGAVIWLVACQVPAFYESLDARIVLSATILSGYCFAAAAALHWHNPEPVTARWIAVVLLVIHGLVYLVRVPGTLYWPQPGATTSLPATAWFAMLTLEALAHVVGLAFALLAMAKERAEAQSLRSITAARDAAAQASEAKSLFLARMSHELRTPLNGVLGLAQVLAQDSKLSPEQREQAATLERAGRHLLAVANDILDLAAVEAGRLPLRSEPIAWPALMQGSVELVRPQAAQKRIALTLEVTREAPAAVLGDATRLRQMVLNLLSNAVKFTPPGGAVRLRLCRAVGGAQRIEVMDTGPGIPPERRGRLFSDFTRLEAAPGREFGGAGLGLAITAALAKAMGGQIGVESGPGGIGSLFWLALPLPEAVPPKPAPGVTSAASPRRRVLVVDDVAPNRMVARILLEAAGHEVALATDGAEAVRAMQDGGFDLVLMDVHMPGMDGLEATRRIRALEAGRRHTPIIALSADALREQVERCREAGMDGHLAKPLERGALLAVLNGI
jgi:signal transduction histidine kinase/CheY-like chemotaxis protein